MTMRQLDTLADLFGYDVVIDGDDFRAYIYMDDALLYGVDLR